MDTEFFDATGINAQYNIKPYFYHLADIQIMVATASTAYDAFDTDYQDIGSFKDHILSPTDLAERYPDLTYSKFNPNAFQDQAWGLTANYPPGGFRTGSSSPSQKVLFVPFNMDIMVQFYRKDVFESAGITNLPVTWDEYFADVKADRKSTRLNSSHRL